MSQPYDFPPSTPDDMPEDPFLLAYGTPEAQALELLSTQDTFQSELSKTGVIPSVLDAVTPTQRQKIDTFLGGIRLIPYVVRQKNPLDLVFGVQVTPVQPTLNQHGAKRYGEYVRVAVGTYQNSILEPYVGGSQLPDFSQPEITTIFSHVHALDGRRQQDLRLLSTDCTEILIPRFPARRSQTTFQRPPHNID